MPKKVLPIIILYNPDFFQLKKLIDSVILQVESICLVDNSDDDHSEIIESITDNYNKSIYYMPLRENVGIAKAQNIGIEKSYKLGYDFVLLLDQDSCLPCDMVSKLVDSYYALHNKNEKIGAIGPCFIDTKSNEISGAVITKWFRIYRPLINPQSDCLIKSDFLIASGSLINLDTIKIVGNMKENLFIDWVDIEWGERANRLGYNSYVLSSLLMEHSIGDETIKTLGRKVNTHSEFRNYFIIRNCINLLFSNSFNARAKSLMFLKSIWYTFLYIKISSNRYSSFKLYFRAIKDGLLGNMDKGWYKDKF